MLGATGVTVIGTFGSLGSASGGNRTRQSPAFPPSTTVSDPRCLFPSASAQPPKRRQEPPLQEEAREGLVPGVLEAGPGQRRFQPGHVARFRCLARRVQIGLAQGDLALAAWHGPASHLRQAEEGERQRRRLHGGIVDGRLVALHRHRHHRGLGRGRRRRRPPGPPA